MIPIKAKDADASTFRKRGFFLLALGLPALVAGLPVFGTGLARTLLFSVGDWLVMASAPAFVLAEPGRGFRAARAGALVGSSTMVTALVEIVPAPQVLKSALAGAAVGAVFALPMVDVGRWAWSRLPSEVEPAAPDLGDPTLDA